MGNVLTLTCFGTTNLLGYLNTNENDVLSCLIYLESNYPDWECMAVHYQDSMNANQRNLQTGTDTTKA